MVSVPVSKAKLRVAAVGTWALQPVVEKMMEHRASALFREWVRYADTFLGEHYSGELNADRTLPDLALLGRSAQENENTYPKYAVNGYGGGGGGDSLRREGSGADGGVASGMDKQSEEAAGEAGNGAAYEDADFDDAKSFGSAASFASAASNQSSWSSRSGSGGGGGYVQAVSEGGGAGGASSTGRAAPSVGATGHEVERRGAGDTLGPGGYGQTVSGGGGGGRLVGANGGHPSSSSSSPLPLSRHASIPPPTAAAAAMGKQSEAVAAGASPRADDVYANSWFMQTVLKDLGCLRAAAREQRDVMTALEENVCAVRAEAAALRAEVRRLRAGGGLGTPSGGGGGGGGAGGSDTSLHAATPRSLFHRADSHVFDGSDRPGGRSWLGAAGSCAYWTSVLGLAAGVGFVAARAMHQQQR